MNIIYIAATETSKFEQFVTFRSNAEQSAHRLLSRTEKLNIHSIFFSDSINRKSHHSDFSNYMYYESSLNKSRCERSTANIWIRFKRNQITFEISQTFVFYIFANIDVFKHVINVVDCFNSSKHRKKKKKRKNNKKKRKKKIFWSFE